MTPQPLHDPEARSGTLPPSEQPLTSLNWRQAGISVAVAVAVAGGVTWLVSTGRAGGAAEAAMTSAVVGNSNSIARNATAILIALLVLFLGVRPFNTQLFHERFSLPALAILK